MCFVPEREERSFFFWCRRESLDGRIGGGIVLKWRRRKKILKSQKKKRLCVCEMSYEINKRRGCQGSSLLFFFLFLSTAICIRTLNGAVERRSLSLTLLDELANQRFLKWVLHCCCCCCWRVVVDSQWPTEFGCCKVVAVVGSSGILDLFFLAGLDKTSRKWRSGFNFLNEFVCVLSLFSLFSHTHTCKEKKYRNSFSRFLSRWQKKIERMKKKPILPVLTEKNLSEPSAPSRK